MKPHIEARLSGGDLRSDGEGNAVADFVSRRLDTLPDLVAALQVDAPVVRGHAADALEKVARSRARAVATHIDQILAAAADPVPMVRWHVAMALGHLCVLPPLRPRLRGQLMAMLQDANPFVASWAIVGLSILAVLEPDDGSIVEMVGRLRSSPSVALGRRAETSIAALTKPGGALPTSWIKSDELRSLMSGKA
jgi:hypothetical protein